MGTYANFINDPYLIEFTIELEKKDACFAPGDSMIGRVVLKAKQNIEAESLKIHFYGSAKLKSKMKSGENSAIYLNHQLDASTKCQSIEADNTVFVQFEEKLSSTLLTSIESKNSSVLYTIRAQMAYKTEENELKIINAVKGFTIVETFDLNVLPFRYFEPPSHNLVKKVDKVAAVLQQVIIISGGGDGEDKDVMLQLLHL
uniref:Arrestin-like N-terminal domain-containing protein n=1 Tax=Panagrolaimus sp. ES5 TaxID=591445 RepID=A0AC34GW16_9BILA